jgi:hypothetical protein
MLPHRSRLSDLSKPSQHPFSATQGKRTQNSPVSFETFTHIVCCSIVLRLPPYKVKYFKPIHKRHHRPSFSNKMCLIFCSAQHPCTFHSATRCCAVLCSSVQCCSVLCSYVRCCAVPCSAVQFCAVLCSDVQFCAVLCSAVQCCAVMCSAVQ